MVQTMRGINIPINRAEGDLEVRIEVENGIITEAWSSGTMFRGFETMMLGRGALDGLVVTPRVCGICSITHLTAAVEALDAICKTELPDNARRLRNLALMAETIQSDIRQAVLMFMVDFANREAYQDHPLGEEAQLRYSPLEGKSAIQVIRETKRLIQVGSIIGGQWPHTSFMVPGGVTSMPDTAKIMQSRIILERFRSWYERSILGCTIERWKAIQSSEDLVNWFEEDPAHQEGEVGFFIRFARHIHLDRIGRGTNCFLSFGNLPLPRDTVVAGKDGMLIGAGFATGTETVAFDPANISEDISHSWFEQEENVVHPYHGNTNPYASGQGGQQYSWVKAPRYEGKSIETGPLAEMIVGGNHLFRDMIATRGPSAFSRELARLVRPAYLLDPMMQWINELLERREDTFYRTVKRIPDGEGAGMIQAARGALGHWVRIQDEKITHYQIITPTSWNGSPRDEHGVRGAWEEALIGTPIKNIKNPVEAGHVIRSFDPCLVCAVHSLHRGERKGALTIRF